MLDGIRRPGFRVEKAVDERRWVLSYGAPPLSAPWRMVLANSPGDGGIVHLVTTLATVDGEPSASFLRALADLNARDAMPGALGVHREGGRSFVQLFLRTPRSFLDANRLEFLIGALAGTADGLRPEIERLLSATPSTRGTR